MHFVSCISTKFFLLQSLVLARSRSRQSKLYVQNLERQKQELAKESAAWKKKYEEEKKAKRLIRQELEELKKSSAEEKEAQEKELAELTTSLGELVTVYRECLLSGGLF